MLKKIGTAGQSLGQLQNQWQVGVWDPGACKGDAIQKCKLHNFFIDVLMHKIDAKLKREEVWRTIVGTITSWQVQNWCQVLMLRSKTSPSARKRVAQASISDRLVHQRIEDFHRDVASSSSKIATCESQVKQMLMHSDQKKLTTKQASQLDIECTYSMSHIC